MSKKIFLFLLIFLFLTQSSYAILKVTKLPYKDAQIERIYKLDNGKYIFIEQWGRGDIIWEYDPLKDKFKETYFKVIDSGIKHGTITLVYDKFKLEITTLRKDLKTDGRHAEIKTIDDWKEDSKRRDFTINAIYLSKKGKIFDMFLL